jgi:hypothetical protein
LSLVGRVMAGQTQSRGFSTLQEADLKSVGASPYLTTGAAVGYWSAKLLIPMLVATEKKVGSASKVTPFAVEKLVNSEYTYKGQLARGYRHGVLSAGGANAGRL